MITEFIASKYNVIGLVGVMMILATYLLLQLGRLSARSFNYSFFNLFGSTLILMSLAYAWNLASVVIEAAWLLISLYGVGKYFYCKRTTK